MKRLITILIVIPFVTFCQNTDSTKTKRISIGINFTLDNCYRTIKPDASGKWIADIRDTLEIQKLGYCTGLNFSWNINKRLALETGIWYSDEGYKTKKVLLIWITPSGQPDPTLAKYNTFIYHYNYIDIPVKANFYLTTKRAKFFISAGVSPSIFISQKLNSILEYSDGHVDKSMHTGRTDFERINLKANVGLGFTYDLTKKLYYKIEPSYRRSITSIVNAPIKEYLYSIGLNIGISYKI